jgi:hypothetical protein
MIFALYLSDRPDKHAKCLTEPRIHTNGISELTLIEITILKTEELSPAANIVANKIRSKSIVGRKSFDSFVF